MRQTAGQQTDNPTTLDAPLLNRARARAFARVRAIRAWNGNARAHADIISEERIVENRNIVKMK